MKKFDQTKYFAYCRKSSESEDRQVASIEDQLRELRQYAEREGIQVLEFFEESQSAHKRGRPIFCNLMSRIENGEAQGLIVWYVNRIARNAFDGGWIITAMDEGSLKEIKTPHKTYGNHSDDKFFLQLEFGMAKKDSDDKGVAVKRAYKGKLEKGWRPGLASIGYMNIGDVGNKTIVADPVRFDIIRKMWDLFLTGTYSVSKIRDIAINEWGLRTMTRKRTGGQPLTMSHMYNIFNNPFYYGYFWFQNPETGVRELYKGSHQPMITEQEFNRGQILLGKKGKQHFMKREFAFTGIMRCGDCGSMISAEEKNQVICSKCKCKFSYANRTACPKCGIDISEMSNPTILKYVYYRCTKKRNSKCPEKYVRVEELEKQFDEVLSNITIDDDYLKLALDYLKEKQELEVGDETTITKSLQEALNNCQARINNLHREYNSSQNIDHSIYSPDEFRHYKGELMEERSNLERQLNGSQKRVDRTNELSERTFNFCRYARYHFENGTLQQKRDVFANIGSNLIIKDRKLSIEALHPYMLIEKELTDQKVLYATLEPKLTHVIKRKEAVLAASSPNWLRVVDDVRTRIQGQKGLYLPNLASS